MKLPAPRGGVSEEGELSVLMELLINPSLLLDVVPYCGLIPMLTYCAGIIPIGPKLSTPQLFLDMRTQAKYLPRCDTFYYRYQLRDAVRRNRLHQKMDVVLIRAYLLKFYLVTLLYLETNIPQTPHPQLHQTPPVDILPETPYDTATPLHYGSYGYTRSREYFTPQGAGNKPRRDLTAEAQSTLREEFFPNRETTIGQKSYALEEACFCLSSFPDKQERQFFSTLCVSAVIFLKNSSFFRTWLALRLCASHLFPDSVIQKSMDNPNYV